MPFSTTSHAKHCSMCYCFVCDAPAPCKYWGKGLLNDDHCHATDKETKWKVLRQTFKCKSVPASYPEERPSVVYPTRPSPRHQEYYEEYTPEEYFEPDEEATVCIGNLPYDIDKKDLALLFKDVGIVMFSEIIYDRETGESRGYGFLTMSTAEEAKKAVEMYNRREMDGRPLTVYKTAATRGARTEETPSPHPSRPVSSSFKIYVDNLPWKVSNSNLKQLFSDYGEVVGAKVVYHHGRDAGRPPFGFVTLATRQESENAIWHLNKQVSRFGGDANCECKSQERKGHGEGFRCWALQV
nr:28 kDa ribonucleoprotein, chloroplastic-like isoform X1 [Aegilops tauschii subsp. strangulata]XP_040260367.1 28 kDa ribonucleoprotein, chloroplastic-like isoform X1 [Aegilops tauschii subsp. strangulata]